MPRASTTYPSGVPALAAYEQRLAEPLLGELRAGAASFERAFGAELDRYGKRWVRDPVRNWSRQWEYPFVAAHLREAHETSGGPVLDAGAGFTFFPFHLVESGAVDSIDCLDFDASFAPLYAAAARPAIRFVEGSLTAIPAPDASYGAVYCISVLEHLPDPAAALDEILRVLRPGGLLLATFDVAADERAPIGPRVARALLDRILAAADPVDAAFEPHAPIDWSRATTVGAVHARALGTIPWSVPVRVYRAIRILLSHGYWQGLIPAMTFGCVAARKR